MHTRRIAFLAAIALACVVALSASQAPQPARASAPIYQALDSVKNLSDASFAKVVAWAKQGGPAVFAPVWDYQQAEAGINGLAASQRWAMLQWLSGNGRGALYAQGVTNSDIGRNRPGADYPVATPTPDPWRQVQFATDTFDAAPSGPIQVSAGIAGAKRDGTSIVACVTFANTAPQAATDILFAFTIKDGNGDTVGTMRLDRKGTFSTGIGIHTWDSYASWRAQSGNRGYNDNCVKKESGVAALPVLEARFITYSVKSVTFADGTTWAP